ncbi:MAG: HyaD/HybD family hydrogenase maturation endopeptidase [Acidobacteriota bacterium]|nr:HyaD/HybD family hydrogenase maturation endopeptidase [Acidobacteriota bacterium]
MEFSPKTKTVVVGIGNLIRTDDGFGLHALERLRRDPRVPAGVTFIDGGTYGLELLTCISDSTHLLLLDAIDVGEPPGTVVRMANEELRGLPGAASVHQVGLADLLAMLPLVSTTAREIVLLGVSPLSTDWGTDLSAPVAAALDALVEEAVAQLARWAGELSPERVLAGERSNL